MSPCPSTDERERFVAGESSPDEVTRITRHAEQCERCQQCLHEARADAELLEDIRRVAARTGQDESSVPRQTSGLARYRILRKLGAGGMGVVYEAEQISPPRRVALKLLQWSALSTRSLRRFERETQVLGRLDHPGIARILEADTYESESGPRPFFAMELVDGMSLSEYAEQEKLGYRERLRLFLKVCDGVEHAHQKGILHRDLKPANLMVTREGQPKILDFGVAESQEGDGPATRLTETGQLVGTLQYMSPEQLGGDPADLDTRSDVYALGLILYEFLSGRRPFRSAISSVPDAIRAITEEEPLALRRALAGLPVELEIITSKALEKSRERRYGSVTELAAELRRFLGHEPILARPPSAWYQLQKLAQRHRTAFLGLAATLVALAGGLAFASVQLVRAQRAEVAMRASREEALAEARTVEAVNEFLSDVFGTEEQHARRPGFTVRDALRLAEQRIDTRPLDPKVEAAVRIALGNALAMQGEPERAEAHLEAALVLRREAYGERHAKVGNSLNALAAHRFGQGEYAAAAALLVEALEVYRAAGARPEWVATSSYNLASARVALEEWPAAEQPLREAIALHEASGHAEYLAKDLALLATVLDHAGRRVESRETAWLALDLLRSQPESIHTAIVQRLVAHFESQDGNFEEAAELLREATAILARFVAEDHPQLREARELLRLAEQGIRESADGVRDDR